MAIFDDFDLPDSPALALARAYLEAEDRQDFSGAAEFFAENIHFNGLALKADGRASVASQIEGFLKQAIESLQLEYVTEIESGPVSRVLALYDFKLKGGPPPQPLCDLITIEGGKITRIDNVFDLRKLPPVPA